MLTDETQLWQLLRSLDDPHHLEFGALVVAGQRIHVGMVHAGRTVTVQTADHILRVHIGDELLTEIARTTTKPITRFKARKPEPPRQQRRMRSQ